MAKVKSTQTGAKKAGGPKKPLGRPSLERLQAEIKERAHSIFLSRTSVGEPGDELSDWLRAEAEIKSKYGL